MKLAIIGSRSFDNYNLLENTIKLYLARCITGRNVPENCWQYKFDEIISGGAIGADALGAIFAHENNIKLTEFIPDWKKYGKKAGILRNEDIIKNCDVVLAFWNSESRGTANSLSIAKKLKKTTIIVYF